MILCKTTLCKVRTDPRACQLCFCRRLFSVEGRKETRHRLSRLFSEIKVGTCPDLGLGLTDKIRAENRLEAVTFRP